MAGGGDWLELAFSTNLASFHFGVGVDPRGQSTFENLAPTPMPGQILANVPHDLAHNRHVYELTIPLKSLVYRAGTPDWRSIGLSLALWNDQPHQGAHRFLTFGHALDDTRVIATRHARVHLSNFSRAEEQSALAIADQLPDLDESRQFLDAWREIRATTPDAAADVARAIYKRHPTGPAASQTLAWLDIKLRNQLFADPHQRVLQIAQEANVDEATRARYAIDAAAYLSQWVYLDPKAPPKMLMVQLFDGQSWDHRISFGQFQSVWTGIPNTPSRRLADKLPEPGVWQELKIPLLSLAMHDKPIAGISFGQLGGGRVAWDRSALMVNSKETPFLTTIPPSPDDTTLGGYWEWVDPATIPPKAAAKAHSNMIPIKEDDVARHDAIFKTLLTAHLPPPSSEKPANSAATIAVLEHEVPKLGRQRSRHYLLPRHAAPGHNHPCNEPRSHFRRRVQIPASPLPLVPRKIPHPSPHPRNPRPAPERIH